MKHFKMISHVPAKAFTDDHPGLIDSFKGFLEDPAGVLAAHLDYIFDKVR